MNGEASALETKFSELLAWERARWREQILLASLGYAFLLALLALPLARALPVWVSPFYFPAGLFLVVATAQFFLRPWDERAALRAVYRLDVALGLEARALTAAEILRRGEPSGAERYVLDDAGEKVKAVDVRALFKRRWSWPARAALPLALLWSTLLWLGAGADFGAGLRPASLADKVKDFSQALKDKAEMEKLRESLAVARSLEALAEERLRGRTNERALAERLGAMERRLSEKSSAPGASGAGLAGRAREELRALRAEAEAAGSELAAGAAGNEGDLLERLKSFPRLAEALEQGGRAPRGMSAGELAGALDKLERAVADELDRRSLADAQEFLSLVLRGRGAGETPAETGVAGAGAAKTSGEKKAGGQGDLAGGQPGARDRASAPSLRSGAGATSRVPGVLGQGESSGFTWRGEAKAGASKIPEAEIAASYRRQIEEDLASEKIPPALKETVKKYFLSLGMEEGKK